jgi:hypothetical protein
MIAPHAYVVEYRVVDACAPPACKIDGRSTLGRVSSESSAAGTGSYVAVGTDKDELFAKRGVVVQPGRSLTFTLPEGIHESVLDMSLADADPAGGPFRASLEVRSGGAVVLQRTYEGGSAPFEPRGDPATPARENKYFTHVREILPKRGERTTVVIRNEQTRPLSVGAPLVLRRVEGRGPRQAILVFFDAVPFPLLEKLYERGEEGSARWVTSWVQRGTVFSQAVSPGQLTGSFVRRFFKADYFRLDGDPSLAGQGFDETPPERAEGPVARIAEQGFLTEAIGSNLYLSPVLSRIGFDVDYNVESRTGLLVDPHVIAERFIREMEQHADDDALFVVWFANTHAPWREGQREVSPVGELGLPKTELDMAVLDAVWRNLLESSDALRTAVDALHAKNNAAERIWILGADHGHTFTRAARSRPWRLTGETVEGGHMHCCLSTQQEARTPLAIIVENGSPSPLAAKIVDEPMSSLAAWSEIERRFGVKLDLPATSAFRLPASESAFDDGLFVSVGNSGSHFARYGELTYHSYEPAMSLEPLWSVSPPVALLLKGSSDPAGDIVAEGLYEITTDPAEKNNLAEARFDDLASMRRKMGDWLAEYADDPEHERYEYVLAFGRPTELSLFGPRGFSVQADVAKPSEHLSRIKAKGSVIRIRDEERPLGVVDVSGDVVEERLLVRCASSGLPLALLDPERPRLNLALSRTNCVGDANPDKAPPPGEAFFAARLIGRREGGAKAAPGPLPELKSALERWGYVREK